MAATRVTRCVEGGSPDQIQVNGPRTTLLLPIFVIGCVGEASPDAGAGASASARSVASVSHGSGCFNLAHHGGIPDDGLDDRVAIQAAIEEASARGGGRVCLGEGRWRVSRAPLGSSNRLAALTIHTPRIELSGEGAGTVIEVVGDQGAGTIYVLSVDPGAHHITLRDFAIDTSGMTNTGEQTHAIQIGGSSSRIGPVEDVRIERILFDHPPTPGMRKGDCLRMLGGPAPGEVRRVIVIGVTFTTCARSGIAIQRGVHDLVIMGNQFTEAGDQDIDSEPTGAGGNSGLAIVGNVFRDNVAATQADWSVTIGGFDGPMSAVTLSNNIFEGRGVNLYRSARTVISGNTFDATMESANGIINSGNRAETIIIHGNTMRRRGADGPMIRVVHASGFGAQNVTISGNEMVQETLGGGIAVESAARLSVVNNGIEWIRAAPAASGVYLRSTIAGAEGTMISGNRMIGSIRYGIYLGATPNPFNTTSVVGNMTTAATSGIRCEQSVAGNFRQPIVLAANNFNSPAQCVAPLVASRP